MRAKIIFAAAQGHTNQHIADTLKLTRPTVRLWRGRWVEAANRLAAVEAAEPPTDLSEFIETLLADAPRSGAPAKFTPEQICQLVAVSCELPADSGRPVSHWTPPELADEVVQRNIFIPSAGTNCVFCERLAYPLV